MSPRKNFYDDFLSWMDWGSFTSTFERNVYDEQATMIDELQDELERMRLREKKLIREYSQKLHILNDRDAAAALESISKKPWDEDLPADELSSKLRAEQRARQNDGIQSRRFLNEVKTKMEGILKDKMKEVLLLEKRVETLEKEKSSLTRQLEQASKTTKVSPPIASTEDSVIGIQFIADETFDTSYNPNHQQQEQSMPPPEISFDNMSNALENLLHGNKDAQHFNHLGVKEMQLFDQFKTLHIQVFEQKTKPLQQKMDTLFQTLQAKDTKIQQLKMQIQSHIKVHDDAMTQYTVDNNRLRSQMVELEKQNSSLEEKVQGLQLDKETEIQNQIQQQAKHDETIRAIKRVLVDVTQTKDREILEVKERLHRITSDDTKRRMEPL